MAISRIHPTILYYGTPVALLVTENPNGTFNLAPMSSSWAIGSRLVLGLGLTSQTYANLRERPELTVNFPDPSLWPNVEKLAPLTGRDPVPEQKRGTFRFEPHKFEASGLSPIDSDDVVPPRVRECPLQVEARVDAIRESSDDGFAIVEAVVAGVYAHDEVHVGDHIDVRAWHPLLYVYRHYFGRGEHLGATFRAVT